jgi:hypothetical protein
MAGDDSITGRFNKERAASETYKAKRRNMKKMTHQIVERMRQGALMVAALVLAVGVSTASALPNLQLDIAGGVYDSSSGTVLATSDSFTLYALLMPSIKTPLSGNYFISAALVPPSGGGSYGSFNFNGTNVDVTTDMVYGVPPIEANLAHDTGDLPFHGIFPTYYSQFGFTFDPLHTATPYNSMTNPGAGPSGSGAMYYNAFAVDTSGLTPGTAIHFDLYNVKTSGSDVDIVKFAPFTHDAQSMSVPVPEPASLMLTAMGAFGMLFVRKPIRGNAHS